MSSSNQSQSRLHLAHIPIVAIKGPSYFLSGSCCSTALSILVPVIKSYIQDVEDSYYPIDNQVQLGELYKILVSFYVD